MAELSNGTASPRSKNSRNFFDEFVKKPTESKSDGCMECFQTFDSDRDGFLSRAEFNDLLNRLFSKKNVPYPMQPKVMDDIFTIIDENMDNRIDLEEFKMCWTHWLKVVLTPVTALLIIDVQNDFISGTLALCNCPAKQDGSAVVAPINYCMDNSPLDLVVYSSDWHPKDHISFVENVKKRTLHHTSKVAAENAKNLDTVIFSEPRLMEQKLWPAHCIQNTWGAQLHRHLKIMDKEKAVYVNKGTNSDIDSYSAFWDNKKLSRTTLLQTLTARGITDVFVCGLAYDICVAATTSHALEHGFRTVLVDDCCRGVDTHDIKAAKGNLQRQGAVVVNSTDVPGMVCATDRRPEIGHFAALNMAMARRLVKEDRQKVAST